MSDAGGPGAGAGSGPGTEAPRFCVLRTPLLPWEAWLGWGADLEAPAAMSVDELGAALAADHQRTLGRLLHLAEDPQIASALLHASPDLCESIDRVRAGTITDGERRSLERSLVRYLTRMAARSEQYGLMAAYTLGEPGPTTTLQISERDAITTTTSVDASLLQQIVRRTLSGADGISLRRNPGIYRAGGRLRVAARVIGAARHRLLALEPTPAIEAALAAAGDGAAETVIVAAAQKAGLTPDAADELISRLRRNDMLIAAAEIAATGPEASVQALAALEPVPGADRVHAALRHAVTTAAGTRLVDREVLAAVAAAAEAAGEPVDRRRLVHQVAQRPGSCRLGPDVLAELERSIALLRRVSWRAEGGLRSFAQAYVRRYGTRAVPLLEALDPDCGLRLDRAATGDVPPAGESARSIALLRILDRGLAHPGTPVTLDEVDVHALGGGDLADLPVAASVLTSLSGDPAGAAPDQAWWVVEPQLIGPSAVRLFGRFGHADERLLALVREQLAHDQPSRGEVVYAELTATPETDAGYGICHRPVLSEWEIEYGGPSSLPPERRIAPEDLVLAVEAGRLVLRSRRLGKRVQPRLSAAPHLGWFSLPASRLLVSLSSESDVPSLRWSWDALANAPRLPRVVHGRTILALARWNLPSAELANVRADASGVLKLRAWRHQYGVPRLVTFDHPRGALPVDFENVLSIAAFLADIRRLAMIALVELLDPQASPAVSPSGHHAHQLVIPFSRPPRDPPAEEARPTRRRQLGLPQESQRTFAPGSEWLYANLYGGPVSADRVLSKAIAPLVAHLREAGMIDRWFFVRYADPDTHLRVRFHGDPRVLTGEVLPALHEACTPALDDGLLYRVSLDTYQREIERYGGLLGVEIMEALAEADSDAVVELLRRFTTATERRHLAAASVASLYDGSGLSLDQLVRCCTSLRDGWPLPGVSRESLGAALAKRERAERPKLEALLGALSGDSADPSVEPLRVRAQKIGPVLAQLSGLEQIGPDLPSILAAHAHMFVNRLLRRGANEDEVRVHDALGRIYESRLARQRYEARTAQS